MLVLFETPAGYAIFKLLDEHKLQKVDDLYKDFETASKVVKLKHFSKFGDMTEALAAATAAIEGKMSKSLKKVLKKVFASDAHEQLAVADAKLGSVIKEKLNISCVCSSTVGELFRGIRAQMCNLITGLPQSEVNAMALGLSHSLSRYKLKISPDKVDTMIVQAIATTPSNFSFQNLHGCTININAAPTQQSCDNPTASVTESTELYIDKLIASIEEY